MIVVRLIGGLGNQMFQYALGRSLELRYRTPMYLDLSMLTRRDFGPHFTYRNYDLSIFGAEPKFFNQQFHIDHVINEPSLLFDEKTANIYDHYPPDKNIYLTGYWQCDKYFSEIETQLKKDFSFRPTQDSGAPQELLEKIRSSNSVAIHIRRTDYLNSSVHGVFGADDVNKAVSRIRETVPHPQFFIFSDDLPWCKANLKIENSIVVDSSVADNRFDVHFQLMVNCRHFIICNSTFSWWAAWLADNQNKMVIAPRKWFANGMQTDIIHDKMGWLRL